MRVLLGLVLVMGCGGPPPPRTFADGCFNLSGAVCERAFNCGIVAERADIGDCRVALTNGCCSGGGGDCDRLLTSKQVTFFTDCEAAAKTQTCSSLAQGKPPPGCGG